MTRRHADLHDIISIIYMIKFVRPDRILNLAAQSFVLDSFLAPADTLQVNLISTADQLDAARSAKIEPLIHIYPSSGFFRQVCEDWLPITESSAFHSAIPYAVSKVGEGKLTVG